MNPAEQMFGHALLLIQAGHPKAEVQDVLADVIKANPKHAEAWALRGEIEREMGRDFNALLHYNQAVHYDPSRRDVWSNRGIIAQSCGLPAVARDSYEKSIAIEDNREARLNLGHLHCSRLEVDEAVEQYRAALKIAPNDAQALTNLGTALIAKGEWPEGWNAYRHRFNNPHWPPRPRINYPWWRGEPLEGKTILLFAEQGYGDEIMALRFVRDVRDRGARVLLSVRMPMFRLARSVAAANKVILQYDDPGETVDYCCALLDVPAFTGITPTTAHRIGYLFSHRPDTLDLPADALKVGICWETGKRPLQPGTDATAKAKSLPFKALGQLGQPGVTLVSLQQSHKDHAEMEKAGVIDPMPGVQDFDDTAWIISQLDLIVSVDTSVAHLAGALGKPVWNLVRFDALWPWMKETRATVWYDSMTLYRQSQPFVWQEPIGRLVADFNELVAKRRQEKVAA